MCHWNFYYVLKEVLKLFFIFSHHFKVFLIRKTHCQYSMMISNTDLVKARKSNLFQLSTRLTKMLQNIVNSQNFIYNITTSSITVFLFPHLLYISVIYKPKLLWPKIKKPFCLFSGLSYEETYCTKPEKAWNLLIVTYMFSLSLCSYSFQCLPSFLSCMFAGNKAVPSLILLFRFHLLPTRSCIWSAFIYVI